MKRNKLLDVMPECYVDTNLIEYLLSAGVNHQHCCSKVVGQLLALKYLCDKKYTSDSECLREMFRGQ